MPQPPSNITPRYEHDCDNCTFLGHFADGDQHYDLYHCMQGSMNSPTVLARRSSDGPDYTSGLEFALHSHPATSGIRACVEAGRRATARGLCMTHNVRTA